MFGSLFHTLRIYNNKRYEKIIFIILFVCPIFI